MSDPIKHECGIGVIRLLKPLEYYQEKYGSALWGLNKLYLLMEKQRNRGQDGAGIGCIKLDMKPGKPYHARMRTTVANPWTHLFGKLRERMDEFKERFPEDYQDPRTLKQNFDYAGEVLMGHLRYGTHGSYGENNCHPVIRTSNYANKSLMLAGNFNLTNVDYLFRKLVELGQHPRHLTDTETMLERIAHFLDIEYDQLVKKYKKEGFTHHEISQLVADDLNITRVLKQAAKAWDGGYAIGGILGNGDMFVLRDPNGIRPCYYYANDEIAIAASERAAICTVFNLKPEEVQEVPPGHVFAVKGSNKKITCKPFFKEELEKKSCSFERIYFSRGSDVDIYQERKDLGKELVPRLLEKLDYDLDNSVFSFIPNTAESAFLGLVKGLETWLNEHKFKQIQKMGSNVDPEKLKAILAKRARVDKVISKDVKMRTFISDDSSRNDLVAHVYDVTRGIIKTGKDTLICIDDSIVRGTTLKKSILQILARLKPKKVIIVSSAPQIRYPDCYGIDMSQIERLVSFQAAIALLEDRGLSKVKEEVYQRIKGMKEDGRMREENYVKAIYEPFTQEEISAKIAEIVRPVDFPYELEVMYQTIEGLHNALPQHGGDWYFSGDYPTRGGNRIVNQSYLNFYEGKNERAYQLSLL
ncbi:MAG: amidophosphoribosyltransferase [Bacteroidota bacterium]